MSRFPSIWHILALALTLWGGEYLLRDLWEPDEARYAYVAQEMRDTGNWAVPHRHGVYYAHKPPLMFWLINLGAWLTGGSINGVTTRLPSLFGAILSLWVVANLARRWADAATAWRALLITMTTYLFWAKSGMGQIDALLTGLELFALYHLVAHETDRRLWRPLAAYTAMGLAVLAKGPVGFAVPFGMYVAATLAVRDGQRRRFAHLAWGPLLALLLPAAWIAWVYWHNPPPGYLYELLFHQNVNRASGELGHVQPIWYYLIHFPLEFLPWTPLWFIVRGAYRAQPEWRPAMRRLLAWIAFVVIFFSISTSKRELYILAAYPPAALLVAMSWPSVSARAGAAIVRFWCGLLLVTGLLVMLAAATDPWLRRIPFDAQSLLLPGAIAVLGAGLVDRRFRHHGCDHRLLVTFAGVMLAVQIAIATRVYPAANALKVPYVIAAAAQHFLQDDDPILLYRMNGEIMALYAKRPGIFTGTPDHLERLIRQRGHGLVVMDDKRWAEMSPAIQAHGVPQTFRMGHKTLAWAHVDFRPK